MSELVELRLTFSRFPQLVASRREWIEQVLMPWCRTATRSDLLLAEQAWHDLAGMPDVEKTLWLWAWQRFPDLYEDGLTAINETHLLQVTLSSGTSLVGFPDARMSHRGSLVLISPEGTPSPPQQLDNIIAAKRITQP